MKQLTFVYLRHDRRQWGGLLCVVIGLVATALLRQYFLWNWLYCAVALAVITSLLLLGYSRTDTLPFFRGTGSISRESGLQGDLLRVECEGWEHRFAEVKEMSCDIQSFFGRCRAVLTVETDRDVIECYSLTLGKEEGFSSSSLVPLFQYLLKECPYLQPVGLEGQSKTALHYVKVITPKQ